VIGRMHMLWLSFSLRPALGRPPLSAPVDLNGFLLYIVAIPRPQNDCSICNL
jgi:hypothetical protein